ncbi:MAG TPA: hypothetical protein VMA98_06990 [Candidatus Acidoferrales bacterium]|nr:hypothetical protein [Candidatus Acidoferrales bacterium]
MTRLRLLFVAVALLVLSVLWTQPVQATIASQQSQISVLVVVDVVGTPVPTATPVGYLPFASPAQAGQPVISSVAVRRLTTSQERPFQAESLEFSGDDSTIVAQAQVQNPLLVQAEVSPNPKATLLVSDYPTVTMTAPPGGSASLPACYFTVKVNMSTTWSLEQGITNDFVTGFPGTDLRNNTYKNSATPQPTSTPYVVYADDGSEWSVLGSGTAITTYCVDLTVTVPSSVTDGPYSTYAVYTLFN